MSVFRSASRLVTRATRTPAARLAVASSINALLRPATHNSLQRLACQAPAIAKQFTRSFATAGAPYHSVVVSIAGPDRSGIVKEFSDALATIEGNIEESRMTVLGQDFAIIVLVTLPSAVSIDSIKTSLSQALPEFVVAARPTQLGPQAGGGPGFNGPMRILQLSAEGPDQPGVVKKMSELLAKYAISIRDLDTDTSSAPFAGYKIFSVKSIIAVPVKVDLETFHDELQRIGDDLGFEVRLDDPSEQEDEEQEGQGEEGQEQEEEEEEERPVRRVASSSSPAGARPGQAGQKPTSAAQMTPQQRAARLAEMEAQMRAAAQNRKPPTRR